MNDTVKWLGSVFLLILVVIAVGAFCEQWESRQNWKATAEQYESQRDSLAEVTKELEDRATTAEERADSAREEARRTEIRAERRVAQAEQAIEEAERAESRASDEADSAYVALREGIKAGKPEVVLINLLDGLQQAEIKEDSTQNRQIEEKNAIIAERDRQLRAMSSLVSQLEEEIAVKDSLAVHWKERFETSDEQREYWENEAKPGLLEFETTDIVQGIALFSIGRLSAEVF